MPFPTLPIGGINYDSTDPTWTVLTIPAFDEELPSGTFLTISFHSEDSEDTVPIWSVSVYQESDSGAPVRVDLDAANTVLGDDDQPNGALALKMIRDGILSVRGDRTPRNNIYNHWYRFYQKSNAAYDAYNDGTSKIDLGWYKCIKREGVTSVQVKLKALTSDGNAADVRVTIWHTGTGSLGTHDFTVASATLNTYSHTFAGLSSDEMDFELRIDGDSTANANTVSVPDVAVIATPGSTVTYATPDPAIAGAGDVIQSKTTDDCRTTLTHLWEVGGADIMIQDYRWGSPLTQEFAGTGDSYNGTTQPNLAWHGTGRDATDAAIAACRALLFSSTGALAIRVRMGYLTSTVDPAITNYIGAGTNGNLSDYEGGRINGPQQWEATTTGEFAFTTDNTETEIVFDQLIPINSAFWESVNPLPVFYMLCRSNDAAYNNLIIPKWISVEEVALGSQDFP